jgi:oxygen-independent coproporphyrinogen-3 oxidase
VNADEPSSASGVTRSPAQVPSLAELAVGADRRVDEFRALRDAGLIHRTGTFVPAGIHYPLITQYPPISAAQLLDGWRDPDEGRYVLYLHVPFCKRHCTFCHYPIVTGADEAAQREAVELLGEELRLWRERLGVGRIRARSVLVGGGTPTHLSPAVFRRMHELIDASVDLSGCAQLTYDVHPADLVGEEGSERLRIMRDWGSTRLTLGVQETHEAVLRHMNRPPAFDETRLAMEACRTAGFDDLNVELIFGYPGQTLASWRESLETIVGLGAEEIQFYRLKIRSYGQGEGPVEALHARAPERFTDNETQIRMKQMAIEAVAAHGYHENLTRVFTRRPEHTSAYTTDQCCRLLDTVGVGPSAFCSFRDRFCIAEPDLGRWRESVRAGELPIYAGMVRDRDAQLRWNLVLPLKNSEVYKELYAERTGERVEVVFREALDRLAAWGLVDEDDVQVKLTAKGRFFADEICTQLSHPSHLPHPAEGYADGPLKLLAPTLA